MGQCLTWWSPCRAQVAPSVQWYRPKHTVRYWRVVAQMARVTKRPAVPLPYVPFVKIIDKASIIEIVFWQRMLSTHGTSTVSIMDEDRQCHRRQNTYRIYKAPLYRIGQDRALIKCKLKLSVAERLSRKFSFEFTFKTTHRASTSMYSLTFWVRFLLPERHPVSYTHLTLPTILRV